MGLQPGEEELPDIAPPIIIPEDPKGTDFLFSWYSPWNKKPSTWNSVR